jgi:hypothetical protein
MEAELGRHDERVDEVRKEVRDKDFENRELALQFETLKGHAIDDLESGAALACGKLA